MHLDDSILKLSIGDFEIDWSHHYLTTDHSVLYQPNDRQNISYFLPDDLGEKAVEKTYTGFSKNFSDVIERIKLLGYNNKKCEKIFEQIMQDEGDTNNRVDFKEFKDALQNTDIKCSAPSLLSRSDGYDYGRYYREEISKRIHLPSFKELPWDLGLILEQYDPYCILYILYGNENIRNLKVCWTSCASDERSSFSSLTPLDQSNQFLIITEGSSDSNIIRKAFSILKPYVADFFKYIDMDKGYPFTGTGNLKNFFKGLVSIKIMNNIIILFDNDTEGEDAYNYCIKQFKSLPKNIRLLKLPKLEALKSINTIGPEGEKVSDINGKAASIECYLDFAGENPKVRWSSYNKNADKYQGALINKKSFCENFLKQTELNRNYDYSKLLQVLDAITEHCISINE